MSTSKSQRIGIWIIAVVLAIGTIGSFFVVIVANDNNANDQAKLQDLQNKYNERVKEYQAKVAAQSDELSAKYYDTFNQYSDRVSEFDGEAVNKQTDVTIEDLLVGEGEEIKDGNYRTYYIGWTSDGKIFDQSINNGKLKAPFDPSQGTISGWSDGTKGMKIGGVRMITMPSEKGYGTGGNGNIPPNAALRFVVMAIPAPETIPEPNLDGLVPKE